jgi:hypothetical protein
LIRFTGYVQNGQYKRIAALGIPVFFMDNVSQLDVELVAQNTIATSGQVMALLWD